MSDQPTDDDVAARSNLLPEEAVAGSADPQAQAQAILQESEDRTLHPQQTRRESTQTPGESREG